MNIQIFGTKKNNDSKKAERYFKERNIKVQYIDMNQKGMSCSYDHRGICDFRNNKSTT